MKDRLCWPARYSFSSFVVGPFRVSVDRKYKPEVSRLEQNSASTKSLERKKTQETQLADSQYETFSPLSVECNIYEPVIKLYCELNLPEGGSSPPFYLSFIYLFIYLFMNAACLFCFSETNTSLLPRSPSLVWSLWVLVCMCECTHTVCVRVHTCQCVCECQRVCVGVCVCVCMHVRVYSMDIMFWGTSSNLFLVIIFELVYNYAVPWYNSIDELQKSRGLHSVSAWRCSAE